MIQPNDKEEILEAIATFSGHVDQKFDQIDQRLDRVESDVGSMKSDIGSMKSDIGSMKSDIGSMKSDIGSMQSDIGSMQSDIGSIKATMVTKDYLDDKLADLRGDLIMNDRRLDEKINTLADHLESANSLPPVSATAVRAIKPLGR